MGTHCNQTGCHHNPRRSACAREIFSFVGLSPVLPQILQVDQKKPVSAYCFSAAGEEPAISEWHLNNDRPTENVIPAKAGIYVFYVIYGARAAADRELSSAVTRKIRVRCQSNWTDIQSMQICMLEEHILRIQCF